MNKNHNEITGKKWYYYSETCIDRVFCGAQYGYNTEENHLKDTLSSATHIWIIFYYF